MEQLLPTDNVAMRGITKIMVPFSSLERLHNDLHQDDCISTLYIASIGMLSSYHSCTKPPSIILLIANHSPWAPSQSMETKCNEAIFLHRFSCTSDCISIWKCGNCVSRSDTNFWVGKVKQARLKSVFVASVPLWAPAWDTGYCVHSSLATAVIL